MKKNYFLILAILILPLFFQAQSFSGEATYQSASSLDFKMDSTQITPEQQKMIKERLSKALQKEYTLTFTKTESLFKEIEQLEEGSGRMAGMMTMMSGAGSLVYKNVQTLDLIEQSEIFGKMFLIRDTLDTYDWKLEKGNKLIGSYTCYKAVLDREVVQRSFRSEEEGGSSFDTTTISITAWYTPQIPLNIGPDIYWGLPGLIMEINTDRTTILCTKVVLNKDKEITIDPPKKGDKVTRDEYTKIVEDKLKEMEEMYGGERRKAGRHGRMQIQISR